MLQEKVYSYKTVNDNVILLTNYNAEIGSKLTFRADSKKRLYMCFCGIVKLVQKALEDKYIIVLENIESLNSPIEKDILFSSDEFKDFTIIKSLEIKLNIYDIINDKEEIVTHVIAENMYDAAIKYLGEDKRGTLSKVTNLQDKYFIYNFSGIEVNLRNSLL